jgi:hypothetical protein
MHFSKILSNRLVEYMPYLSTENTVAREQKRVADVLSKGSKGTATRDQDSTSSTTSSKGQQN